MLIMSNNEYKGFRCWPIKFQCLSTETTGVSIEYERDGITPTGRLLLNGVFGGYYPNTQTINGEEVALGVKASLEDTLSPLVDPTINGVGWSLDTDLYSRLNALSDSEYSSFKSKNPLLWTPTTQILPNGNDAPKSVRLIPCAFVYAMFFKHTSGYRLMISLNYTSMVSGLDAFTTSYGYRDAGWLFDKTHPLMRLDGNNTLNRTYFGMGGFMLSMIPPANKGEIQDEWHPEYSIRDSLFYPPSSFPIIGMFVGEKRDSNSYYYNMGSWLRQGSNTSYDPSASTTGIVVGTNLKTTLLADSKGNIGVSYLYKASSNTTIMNPTIFIGPFYKNKVYGYDSSPQYKILAFFYSCILSHIISGRHCAWCNSYSSNYYNYGDSYQGNNNNYIADKDTTIDSTLYKTAYTAFPALPSNVTNTYRYAKALYTVSGLLDEDVIRSCNSNGLISGQTFNNGTWCFINNIGGILAPEDGTTSSSLLNICIRWDTDFNENELFC